MIVEEQEHEVLIRVLDEGPGVDPTELELIFDSFYRSGRTADLPGKGLGLGICRRLVEAQGGTIQASLRPAGGLEVAFSLRRAGERTTTAAEERPAAELRQEHEV